MSERLLIEAVTPLVDGGRHASKAVVGECLPIGATVWREGHESVSAAVVWRGPGEGAEDVRVLMAMVDKGLDRWQATVVPDRMGMASFHIEAWSDPWVDWRAGLEAKIADGYRSADLANELELGAQLLDRAVHGGRDGSAGNGARSDTALALAAARLRDHRLPLADRVAPALSDPVTRLLADDPIRELVTRSATHQVYVDRQRALYGSWYELFPRSTGGWGADGRPVHGTFRTAIDDLPRIAAMEFDVVYLAPIHPIGVTRRKGRNGVDAADDGDPGCPWAIGSAEGGHDAIDPRLGGLDDFDAYVNAARGWGLEVAMDFTLQCSPDHPWVTDHPEWFTVLPDGSIACAEDPPRKWQDVYPLNFDRDRDGLYAEILRVLMFWIERGVRIFRVDNPHTKPADFWAWLIWKVKDSHPDVLFLAEAFTRPAPQQGLSKIGFTQTYTYFIWRTAKQELTRFGEELVEMCHFLRPNLFPTTHDILPEGLRTGELAMFAIRAALAATLSPSWGVYSGYEIYEHEALRPDSQEYLDSEKFQLRPRDFAAARAAGRSLEPWITRLNRVRRAHPALQQLRTLRFHHVDNDNLLAYSKTDPATGDAVICVVTLKPHGVERGTVSLGRTPGLPDASAFPVIDEVTGERGRWSAEHAVVLDPSRCVAHIVSAGKPRSKGDGNNTAAGYCIDDRHSVDSEDATVPAGSRLS